MQNEGALAGPGRRLHIAILAWVSMLGTDLLIHGGILARLCAEPSQFLLDPETAFRRLGRRVAVWCAFAFAVTVILQRTGLAPAGRVIGR